MKLYFIKSFIITTLCISIIATGCLKDTGFNNGSTQSESQGSGQNIKVISLGLSVSSSGFNYTSPVTGDQGTYPNVQFISESYPLTLTDTILEIVPVELGGPSAATEDIHVTLIEDTQLVITYNDSTGADYTSPDPIATIVNPNNVVTIPKGSRTGFLQIKLKTNDLLTADYAYGFRIKSIAENGYTISGNLSAGVVAIGPKNQYDGIYESSGEFIHPVYGDQTWDFSKGLTQSFITTGLNSIKFVNLKTPAVTFGVEMDITINPDNSLSEILNGNPTPTPNNDHYDPATKTFYVSGSYSGGSRKYTGILTYKGPR